MTTDQQRQAFEAWDQDRFDINWVHYGVDDQGKYLDEPIRNRWQAWQAGAAQSARKEQT